MVDNIHSQEIVGRKYSGEGVQTREKAAGMTKVVGKVAWRERQPQKEKAELHEEAERNAMKGDAIGEQTVVQMHACA